jgi:hypothetical protein
MLGWGAWVVLLWPTGWTRNVLPLQSEAYDDGVRLQHHVPLAAQLGRRSGDLTERGNKTELRPHPLQQ